MEDEIVLPEVEARGEADAVIFDEPFGLTTAVHRHAELDGSDPVVSSGAFISTPDVDVGLAGPEVSGGVGLTFAKVEPVVQHDQIRAIFPAFLEHFNEGLLFLWAQLAADGVHLEEVEIEIPAKFHEHVGAGLFLLWGISEAVRPEPDTEATVEGFRFGGEWAEAVGELLLETLRVHAAVAARGIDGSCVQRVDIERHAVVVMQPFEKIQIREGLLLGGALVGVIDPRKIMTP